MEQLKICWPAMAMVVTLATADGAIKDAPDIRKFLQTYCTDCHGTAKTKAGLRVDNLGLPIDPDNAVLWQQLKEVISDREMPPAGSPQPDARLRGTITQAIDLGLQHMLAAHGREQQRRLTRHEYSRTVNAVLGLDVDWTAFLPDDGLTDGFDTLASGLGYSPSQLEAMLSVAERAVAYARHDYPRYQIQLRPDELHGTDSFDYSDDIGRFIRILQRQEQEVAAVVWGCAYDDDTQALEIAPFVPAKAPYRRAELSSHRLPGVGFVPRGLEPGAFLTLTIAASALTGDGTGSVRLRVNVNRMRVAEWPVTARPEQPQEFRLTIPVPTNIRSLEGQNIGFRIELENAYDMPDTSGRTWNSNQQAANRKSTYKKLVAAAKARGEKPPARPKYKFYPPDFLSSRRLPMLYVHAIKMDSMPATRLEAAKTDDGGSQDWEARFAPLLRRAYRRPVTEQDWQPFRTLHQHQRQAGRDAKTAFETLVVALLVSATTTHLPAPAAVADRHHALASRLSYLFWGGPPDVELLAAAQAGLADDQAAAVAQVERLLSDERSRHLIDRFTAMWLELADFSAVTVPHGEILGYQYYLRDSFRSQPGAFVAELIRRNAAITRLVAPDFLMLNDRLAAHLGVPDVTDARWRAVDIPAGFPPQAGVVTMPAVMAYTGQSEATPVFRGAWMLRTILDDPPPPPPLEVPELGQIKGRAIRTILRQHQEHEACAVCHRIIDPIGYAFENFNGLGHFKPTTVGTTGKADRNKETNTKTHKKKKRKKKRGRTPRPVDTRGQFPSGRTFSSLQQFRGILLEDHRATIARSFTRRFMSYALGRRLDARDQQLLEQILEQHASADYPIRDLIIAITTSRSFRGLKPNQP